MKLVGLVIISFVLFALPSRAQTIYTYTGNPFNNFGGTAKCPPECNISGSFSVSKALGANFNGSFTPNSFSFTDGLVTVTQANASKSDFGVITDSNGNITAWNMDFFSTQTSMFSGTNPPGCIGCSVLDGSFNSMAYAEIVNDPGSWSCSGNCTSLQVIANGKQIASGDCTSISSDNPPLMPAITAVLAGKDLSGKVKWSMQVAYTAPDNSSYSFSKMATLPVGQTWQIPFGNTFIGGSATVGYTYGGQQSALAFCIDGQNPTKSAIESQLGTVPWFLLDIASAESSFRQFGDDQNPLFGPPHGFGIMQIDPPRNELELFSWTQNAIDGTAKLNTFQRGAVKFWERQEAQYQQWASKHNGQPPPPGDDVESNCTFSYSAGLRSLPLTDHSFSDAIWIKQYNGAPDGNYIDWQNTGPYKTKPFWEFHQCNGNGCYVNLVCSQNP